MPFVVLAGALVPIVVGGVIVWLITSHLNKCIHERSNRISDSPLAQNDGQAISIHDHLKSKIEGLETLKQCSDLYDSYYYQECIRLLRSSQRKYEGCRRLRKFLGISRGTIATKECFAKHWAIELSEEEDWAWALNRCRRTALLLLYKVCDLSYGADGTGNGPSRTGTETFKSNKIYQILIHCLVMDRANTLYNMNGGQGWYTESDLPEWTYKELLPLNSAPAGKATINKRLRILYRDTSLGLDQDEAISKWIQRKAPPQLQEEEKQVRQLLEELRQERQNEEEVQRYLLNQLQERQAQQQDEDAQDRQQPQDLNLPQDLEGQQQVHHQLPNMLQPDERWPLRGQPQQERRSFWPLWGRRQQQEQQEYVVV